MIFYGINNIFSKIQREERFIYFPSCDIKRSKIFGDPVPNVLKVILIIDDINSVVMINNKTAIFYDQETCKIYRHSMPPFYLICHQYDVKKCAEEILQNLHESLTFSHGSLKEEYPEQLMAMMFLEGKEIVLEIGANIGRNSVVVGSILNNSSHLVSMESDYRTIPLLDENRRANHLKFAIEPAALSRQRLIQQGWVVRPYISPLPSNFIEIATTNYSSVVQKYFSENRLSFDTLILDCEGSFYNILNEFPEILVFIETIIIENDYTNIEQKRFMDFILNQHQFMCVYSQKLEDESHPCHQDFYQVWKHIPTFKDVLDKNNLKYVVTDKKSDFLINIESDILYFSETSSNCEKLEGEHIKLEGEHIKSHSKSIYDAFTELLENDCYISE